MQNKVLRIALWVVQILLGLFFPLTGAFKLVLSSEELLTNAQWVHTTGIAVARFTGVMEILAGLGMILPSATRIAPKLTPIAALGIVLMMAVALAIHLARGDEMYLVPANLVFGAMAAFVAWGRLVKAPIPPR